MKRQLDALLQKVDALSLRERLFLVLSVLACFLAVVDAVWLSPLATAAKRLTDQANVQDAERIRLRAELAATAQPVDVSEKVREEIAQADTALQKLDADIQAVLPASKGGPVLEDVLVQLLRKQDGLTLIGLATVAVPESARNATLGTGNGMGAEVPSELRKRGLELRIKGPYLQLIAYLQKLESALPSLRWGGMQLRSEAQPPELTLKVYVLGVNAP